MRFSVSASLLAVAAIVATCNAAALNVSNSSLKRCTNSASNRKCWGNYDITTDYENVVPETGVTREVMHGGNNVYILLVDLANDEQSTGLRW